MEDPGSDSDIEEYSGIEQPPLLQQLKQILSEYRNDVQIIKELVQNADDAGATVMKVLYQGETINEKIAQEKKYRKFFRAPALVFYNDAEFNDKDWRGIRTIYSSIKADNPLQIGRFGLGFKSVFHLTDYPCIVSGDRILFIDPHERQSGKVCVTVKLKCLTKWTRLDVDDCFRALNDTFGFSKETLTSGKYNGTLFWFPLRTGATDLSDDIYNSSQVLTLLNAFILESKRSLIFLKTLCKVVLFLNLHENNTQVSLDSETSSQLQDINFGKHVHLYSVEIQNDNGDLIKIRKEFLTQLEQIGRSIPERTLQWTFDVYVTTESKSRRNGENKSVTRWLLVNFLKGGDTSDRLRELLKDDNMCYLHLVGVAAPIFGSEETISEFQSGSGHIFCYQPLPQETKMVTGLPVHVNAFFVLSQNRRQIKWPDQDGNQIDKAMEWNRILVSELLSEAYCELLTQMIHCCQINGNLTNFVHSVYNLIPDLNLVGSRWIKLAQRFLELCAKQKMFLTKLTDCSWITASEAIIEPLNARSDWITVEKLLLMDHIPLVRVPDHVLQAFRSNLHIVTAAFISQHMQVYHTYKYMHNEDKSNLLKYIFSEGGPRLLANLELLPLENNTYASFGSNKDAYLADNAVVKLFASHRSQFVSSTADPITITILKEMIMSFPFQLSYMNSATFARFVHETLHGTFGTMEIIEVTSSNCQQMKDWIQKVWTIIEENYRQHMHSFRSLAIFPITSCTTENSWTTVNTFKLVRLTNLFELEKYHISNIIQRETFFQSLELLQMYAIGARPQWLNKQLVHEYIYTDSFDSLTKMIQTLSDSDINRFNEKANKEQRLHFLLLVSSRISEKPTARCIQILRKFKVFTEYKSVESQQNQFVCLDENENIYTGKEFPVRFPTFHIITDININNDCVKHLEANTVNEMEMVRCVLKEIKTYEMTEIQTFMLWLLKHDTYLREKEILCLARNVTFVATENGVVRKPSDLFDPEDKHLRNVFRNEPLFPYGYEKSDTFQGLRKLGMKSINDVNSDDIENTCRIMHSMSTGAVPVDLEKAHALLKFLNEDTDLLRNTALLPLSFIPLPKERFAGYSIHLPCKTTDCQSMLCRPSDVKSSQFTHLIGSVSYLIDTKHLTNLSKVFKWGEQPVVADVVENLAVIVGNYQQKYKSSYLATVTYIYMWLAIQDIPTVQTALEQTFEQHNYVWTGDGFTNPKNVIVESNESDLNLMPFISILPEELLEIKDFFLNIGCARCMTVDTYIDTLERIKDVVCQDFKYMSVSALRNMAVTILNKLKSDYAEDVRASGRQLYFPIQSLDNNNLAMKPAQMCAYYDAQWLRDLNFLTENEDVSCVHSDVPNATSDALGVPSLRKQMLSDAEAFEEWGQEEPLTRRLHNLIKEGYVDGFCVAKELFQNADDAGASRFWIMYDERENLNSRTHLINEGMAEWQGPALWFYNDAEFTDKDLKNITKLSGATKEDDSTKIGKFGLGFCAVYNITDVPSFVSRENIVIFDPHTSFLGKALSCNSPGLKINFRIMKNLKMLQKLRNQFEPFENVFGCKLLSSPLPYFKGTLFRLPLRSKVSEISANIYTESEVQILLDKIMDMSANLFIFNQHVQELKLFHLSKSCVNPENAREIFQIDKKTMRLNILPECLSLQSDEHSAVRMQQRSIMVDATTWKRDRRLHNEPISMLDKVSVKVQSLAESNRRCCEATWLVSWSTATDEDTLKMAYEEQGALPLGAVAVPVITQNNITQATKHDVSSLEQLPEGFYKIGHFFFFLPLPVEHNFQWHINGHFSVTSDRRHLRTATEDDTNTHVKKWNNCLLNGAVINSLLHLLEGLKKHCCEQKYLFHRIWPRNDSAALTKSLPSAFYKALTQTNLFKLFKSNTKWSDFNESIFLHPTLRRNKDIGDIALELMSEINVNENVIDTPEDVFELLSEAEPLQIQNKAISLEFFLLKYFLPNLTHFQKDQNKGKSNKVLYFAILYENTNVSDWLRNNRCIPTQGRDELMMPSMLIDPTSEIGKMFVATDGYFPAAPFNEPTMLIRLKNVGIMHETLSDVLVVDRASSIGRLNEACSKCALSQCGRLLSYLCHNRERHLDVLVALKEMPWLPVMTRPNNWPFCWKADSLVNTGIIEQNYCKTHTGKIHRHTFVLESPTKLFDTNCCNLVGCSCYIFDWKATLLRSDEMKLLVKCLGVIQKEHINVQIVIEQLEVMSQAFLPDKIFKVNEIMTDIYCFLDNVLKNRDLESELSLKWPKDKSVVFVGDVFKTPNRVAQSLFEHCAPYLYGLHSSPLKQFNNLCQALEVKQEFAPKEFGIVLQEIHEDCANAPLSEEKLNVCLNLVNCLHKSLEKSKRCVDDILDAELKAIFLPDDQCVLQIATTMCFDDYDSISKSDSMKYVHKRVHQAAAKAFGVKKKIIHNLEEHSEDIEDFYQDEPLLTRLRRLITGYPEDTGIFKELLQNADDAGAKHVTFLKDFTSHRSQYSQNLDEVFNSLLLGPSLCFFNDSSFSQKDLSGITKLGQGSKSDDPSKTGRFGVGFNAVYNITDTPSFFTKGHEIENGETLCFFDPNAKYVPNVSTRKPGKRYKNLVNFRVHHSDVFSCYHEERFFTDGIGTMFRFPLRNHDMAMDSEIKNEPIDIETIELLLVKFRNELSEILIFLKHIQTVSVITYDNNNYSEDYSITVQMSDEDLLKRQVFFQKQKDICQNIRDDKELIFMSGQVTVDYSLFYSEHLGNQLQDIKEKYRVVQMFGFPENSDIPDIVKKKFVNGTTKDLPHGAVALPLFQTTRPCKAFCFLPLPIETGLPVHVHGYFELVYESRRNLWKSEETSSCFRSQWNDLLIHKVISPAYAHLLEIMKNQLLARFTCRRSAPASVNEALIRFHSIFPEHDRASHFYWKQLVKYLYNDLVKNNIPFLPVITTERKNPDIQMSNTQDITLSWTSLRQPGHRFPAYCSDESIGKSTLFSPILNYILIDIGMRVASIPAGIYNSMKFSGVTIDVFTPKHVIDFLSSFNEHLPGNCNIKSSVHVNQSTLRSIGNATTVFCFCLKDMDYFLEHIEAIPIIITQDNIVRTMAVVKPLFLTRFCKFFEKESHLFLHKALYTHFVKEVNQERIAAHLFKSYTLHDFADHARRSSILNVGSEAMRYWDQINPLVLWIRNFWYFFESAKNGQISLKENLAVINRFSLLPAKEMNSESRYLVPINQMTKLIDLNSFQRCTVLRRTIEKLNLSEIDDKVLSNIQLYQLLLKEIPSIYAPDLLVKCLHANKSLLEANALTSCEAMSLLQYFCNSIRNPELQNVKSLMTDLPIFISHCGNVVSLSSFSKVCVAPGDLPIDGIHDLSEHNGVLILRESGVEELFKFLNVFCGSVCVLYRDFIFPCQLSMSRPAFYKHIEYINKLFHSNRKSIMMLLAHLAELAFVERIDRGISRIKDLFNPFHNIFSVMCSDLELLPSVLRELKFISLFDAIGLQSKMTIELFERFAKKIFEEVQECGRTEDIIKKSSLLSIEFCQMDIEFFRMNSLETISTIPFIAPLNVDENLIKIHEQHFATRYFISFSGSAIPGETNICWTVSNILPESANVCKHYFEQELEMIKSKLHIRSPDFEMLKQHCKNVGKSLEKRLKETPREISISVAETVLRAIFTALNKCLSTVIPSDLLELRNVPLFLFQDEKFMRKACCIVLNCKSEEEIPPYIQKVPANYEQHYKVFRAIGASEEPSYRHYATVLATIAADSGLEALTPPEEYAVRKALGNLFKHLFRKETDGCVELEVDNLYLLNRERMLCNAQQTVIVNSNYYYGRLIDGIKLNYFIPFDELSNKGMRIEDYIDCLRMLPIKHRPHLLTDIVVERVLMTNIIERDMHNARTLEDFLTSRLFKHGFIRLARHSAKMNCMNWSNDMESKCAYILSNVTCRHVSGISTIIALRDFSTENILGPEKDIENSVEERNIHLEETNNTVTVYFDQTDSKWRKKVREELSIFFNKSVGGCLKDSMLFVLLEMFKMEQTPENISGLLDDNLIDMYEYDNITEQDEVKYPKPGKYIPTELHKYLDNDYGAIYKHDYKFIALEVEDRTLEELSADEQASDTMDWAPLYMWVRIIRKLEPDSDLPLLQMYEIDAGDEVTKHVPAYMLYKFVRPTGQENNEILDLEVYTGLASSTEQSTYRPTQTLKEVFAVIRRYLRDAKSETERRRIYKRLIFRWHPDKNPDNVAFCTIVCQYIQKCIQRLENGQELIDDDYDNETVRPSGTRSSWSWYWHYKDYTNREWRRQRETNSSYTYRQNGRHYQGHSESFESCFNRTESEPVHLYNEARKWQRQAERDLANAGISSQDFNWICYESHQAAEKSLKAAWYAEDANKLYGIHYSHELGTIALGLDNELYVLARDLSNTTGDHTRMRYPDKWAGGIPAEGYDNNKAVKVKQLAADIIRTVQRLYIR